MENRPLPYAEIKDLLDKSFNYNGIEFIIYEVYNNRILAYSLKEPDIRIEIKDDNPKFKELQARKGLFKRPDRDIKKNRPIS